jgi:hypothetical protein
VDEVEASLSLGTIVGERFPNKGGTRGLAAGQLNHKSMEKRLLAFSFTSETPPYVTILHGLLALARILPQRPVSRRHVSGAGISATDRLKNRVLIYEFKSAALLKDH